MCQSTCCVDWFVDAPICMYNAIRFYVQKVSTQHVVTKAFVYHILGL